MGFYYYYDTPPELKPIDENRRPTIKEKISNITRWWKRDLLAEEYYRQQEVYEHNEQVELIEKAFECSKEITEIWKNWGKVPKRKFLIELEEQKESEEILQNDSSDEIDKFFEELLRGD